MSGIDGLHTRVVGHLVEVLSVSPEECRGDARFFEDLGGESIDLLDLGFRLQRDLGVPIEFNRLTAREYLTTNDAGVLTADSRAKLQAAYPFLRADLLPDDANAESLFALLTVDAIVAFVAVECASRSPNAAPAC